MKGIYLELALNPKTLNPKTLRSRLRCHVSVWAWASERRACKARRWKRNGNYRNYRGYIGVIGYRLGLYIYIYILYIYRDNGK